MTWTSNVSAPGRHELSLTIQGAEESFPPCLSAFLSEHVRPLRTPNVHLTSTGADALTPSCLRLERKTPQRIFSRDFTSAAGKFGERAGHLVPSSPPSAWGASPSLAQPWAGRAGLAPGRPEDILRSPVHTVNVLHSRFLLRPHKCFEIYHVFDFPPSCHSLTQRISILPRPRAASVHYRSPSSYGVRCLDVRRGLYSSYVLRCRPPPLYIKLTTFPEVRSANPHRCMAAHSFPPMRDISRASGLTPCPYRPPLSHRIAHSDQAHPPRGQLSFSLERLLPKRGTRHRLPTCAARTTYCGKRRIRQERTRWNGLRLKRSAGGPLLPLRASEYSRTEWRSERKAGTAHRYSLYVDRA